MSDFHVKLPLRIDWSEMDLFGHVNNVAYFKYVQAARVNYWEVIGMAADFEATKVGPILLSTGCQFMQPLFYPGNIVVESRVEFIKNTSFGIHHRIINDKGELAAEAHDVIVNFDFNKNTKVPLAAKDRAAIETLEQRVF
jgi:acyl-CoA thioester hydrolase